MLLRLRALPRFFLRHNPMKRTLIGTPARAGWSRLRAWRALACGLAVVVFAQIGWSGEARAQTWTIGASKQLCLETLPTAFAIANAYATANPPGSAAAPNCHTETDSQTIQPYVPVYYATIFHVASVQANPSPLAFSDSAPAGFMPTGTTTCTIALGPQSPLVINDPNSITNLQVGQYIVCIYEGVFTNPGAFNVTNTASLRDAGGTTIASSSRNDNVASNPVLPTDLAVTKTVDLPNPPLNVSGGPQIVEYTITITNLGPTKVYVGSIFELTDQMALFPTSAALGAEFVSATCQALTATNTPSTNTDCLDTTPNFTASGSPVTIPTNSWLDLVRFRFPSGSLGRIAMGEKIVLKIKIKISRLLECVKVAGGDGLHNRAAIGLTAGTVPVTQTEQGKANNFTNSDPPVANAADVPVDTGAYFLDPDCGVVVPGPVEVAKKQIKPSGPVAWGSSVDYIITIKNGSSQPVTNVSVRDFIQQGIGTPMFTAEVVFWACLPPNASLCTGTPGSLGPQALQGYLISRQVWDGVISSIPGGVTINLHIRIQFRDASCDVYDKPPNDVFNWVRVAYDFNNTRYRVAPVSAKTEMQKSPPCMLVAEKKPKFDKVVFNTWLEYSVQYKNNHPTDPRQVGTLIDAFRIVQDDYATQLRFDYKYKCTASAGVTSTGSPAIPSVGSGTAAQGAKIVHTTLPSQGARVIQLSPPGFITFAPGATLTCTIYIFIYPPVNDLYCKSTPAQLENLVLIDVQRFYNPNVFGPPLHNYVGPLGSPANTQASPDQPSQPTNWHTVASPLPKCHRLIANKSASPTATWVNGGPVTFTVTVDNRGGDLTGSPGAGGVWNGPLIGDVLPAGVVVTGVTATMGTIPGAVPPCVIPASWHPVPNQGWSGQPGAPFSFLLITNFPKNCRITLTFTVAGPFKPGKLCNRVGVGWAPDPNPDWYANDPKGMHDEACVPVLPANDLTVRKQVVNLTPGPLPSPLYFLITVNCTNAALGSSFSFNQVLNIPASKPVQTVSVPVGSECTITESTPPPPQDKMCPPPSVAQWDPPLYKPANPAGASHTQVNIPQKPGVGVGVTVVNTLRCATTLRVAKDFVISPPGAFTVPATAIFPVQVVCTPDPPGPNTIVNLTSANNFSELVLGVPLGSNCTITELQAQVTGFDLPPGCTWSVSYPLGSSTTINIWTPQRLQVTNTIKCIDPPAVACLANAQLTCIGGGQYQLTASDPLGVGFNTALLFSGTTGVTVSPPNISVPGTVTLPGAANGQTVMVDVCVFNFSQAQSSKNPINCCRARIPAVVPKTGC